jgi:hypothetical protein
VSEFFHEVEEEVRRERWLSLWKSYGGILIAAVVLLVVGVAGFEIWKNSSAGSREDFTDALVAAQQPLELENYKDAVSSLNAMRDKTSGDFRAMAMLREAEARIGDKDTTGAIATLDAIAADSGVTRSLRDLASIYSAYLQLDKASFDEINSRMGPLTASGSAWRSSALELIGFSAYRNGKLDVARQQFETLSTDPGSPPAVRQRALATLDAIRNPVPAAAQPNAQTDAQPNKAGNTPAGDGE